MPESVSSQAAIGEALRTRSIQSELQSTMHHLAAFKINTALPNDILSKLAELNRIFANHDIYVDRAPSRKD